MPKVYRGSTIDDMFIAEKIDCFNPSRFPRPRASASVIDYRWFLYGFCQCLSLPYFADVDGDRLSLETSWRITHANQLCLLPMSMVHRRSTISVTVWPLYLLEFFDVEHKHVSRNVSCRFLVRMSSYFRHKVSFNKFKQT
jgi:hypothetical protein